MNDFVENVNDFDLFEFREFFYLSTGQIQLSNANMLAPNSFGSDPTRFSEDVLFWLSENESEGYDNPITGVPTFRFLSEEKRNAFIQKFGLAE